MHINIVRILNSDLRNKPAQFWLMKSFLNLFDPFLCLLIVLAPLGNIVPYNSLWDTVQGKERQSG